MSDEDYDHRRAVREALQDHIPSNGDDIGVLTGYVVVAQWSDPAGREWLTQTTGNINDETPAPWTVKGWLGHALDTHDQDDEG